MGDTTVSSQAYSLQQTGWQAAPMTPKTGKKDSDKAVRGDHFSLNGSHDIDDEEKMRQLKNMARDIDSRFDSHSCRISAGTRSALCVAGVALAVMVQPWYLGAAILAIGLFTPFEHGGAII